MAKSASVTDRVKLFETQRPPSVDQHTDLDREIKAAAIKREIEEARAAQKRAEEVRKREEKLQKRIMGLSTTASSSSDNNVEMQSPIESKVKPLKIPMKPKIIGPASPNSPGSGPQQQQQSAERGVPGARLRINQPAGQEIKSILRTTKSSNSLSVEEQQAKRLSIENLPSIKSKIGAYEEGKPIYEAEPPPQPKSILKDKSPRLVHSNDNAVSIYAQSATDLSDEEDQGQQIRRTPRGMLEVPNGGIKKSNSLSSNLVVDQEKKDTVMAFFGGTRWANFGLLGCIT